MKNGKRVTLLKVIAKKRNYILFGFLVFYVIGYALFFTSKSWLDLKGDLIKPTSINREITWQDRGLSIISWHYSKQQRMMEIQLSLDNNSLDGISKYKFSAVDRNLGMMNVSQYAGNTELLIIRITDVKDNWSEISLRMDLDEKSHSQTYETLKIYTNKYEIDHVVSIKNQTINEYMVENLNSQIKQYQKQIAKMNKNITADNKLITNCKEEISNLNNKKQYQTDQENKDTDNLIANANSKISDTQNEISILNSSISEYQQRINKISQKKQQYTQ